LRLILTNDDGIDAPGLEALYAACADLGEILVAAPDRCHSSMSHRVTTDTAIEVTEIAPDRFRVAGTPADCARIAIACLAPEAEWAIAGINRGGNLGADTYISGTVAAAREAALLGRHAVAISQYVAKGRAVDWSLAGRWARAALARILGEEQRPGIFWNVNLPHPVAGAREPEIVFCPADTSPLDVRFRRSGSEYWYCGDYHGRPRIHGSDVERCFAGDITVTELTVSGR
jgi:5'-nucleotidase